MCFHCNKLGHIKKDCYTFKNLKNQKEIEPNKSFLLECCVSYIEPFSWWVDYGATIHVSMDFQWFKEIKKIEDGKSFVFMGNDDRALIEGVGTYALKLQENKVFFS